MLDGDQLMNAALPVMILVHLWTNHYWFRTLKRSASSVRTWYLVGRLT